MVEANRRQASLGRTQFFDPERRDETMFSAITKGKWKADHQANTNVLNRINMAVNNLRGNSTAMLPLANMEAERREQRRQQILAGLSAGGKAASSMIGGMGGMMGNASGGAGQ
jgi:ferric-dicitrate binding protein FerR (iron transport regulator)